MSVLDGFVFCAQKNLDYGQKLVADLTAEQMIQQPAADPAAPANHPAWVLSHLNAYLPIMLSALNGELFEDPKTHPFGMQSQPVDDASVYQSKDELIAEFTRGHEAVISKLQSSAVDVLQQPIELARWQSVLPTVGVCLPYLLCNHENIHLGQISAWRRIQGLASV